jgi:3-methyladenine DNA glycosylase AlkD
MATLSTKTTMTQRAKKPTATTTRPDVDAVLRELERQASKQFRADMASRYGIVTQMQVFGTPMAKIKAIANPLGHDHALADALWQTGVYEARMLATLVDDPERVTAAQMDRWIKDCDNWAIVDTLAFNLFDRTPHAFAKVAKWSKSRDEFVKRAGFALLACVALHGHGQDEDILETLPLIAGAANDERNFVKKAVSWALRAIGGKRSPKLRTKARSLANSLAQSQDATARWIGRDALKAFAKAKARS